MAFTHVYISDAAGLYGSSKQLARTAVLWSRTYNYVSLWDNRYLNNFAQCNYYVINHNYNKIVNSDWLSTALILALIGQFSKTVRVMPK